MTAALSCIAIGAALGFIAARLLRTVRNTAADSAQGDAWRREYDNERQRHYTPIAQMQRREAAAAANLVQLSAALQQAAAERGAAHVASVPPAMKFWVN